MSIDWHENQWKALLPNGAASLSRLPHAMLLTGSQGLGKQQFADSLAALLLCESPNLAGKLPMACNQCQGCHWLAGENHPDFRRVAPESDDAEESSTKEKKRGARQIKIDAIRDLEDFVFVGSHRHGNRVTIINQADAMNAAAANALLKILEEPPPSVYFILTTNHQAKLLATIRSRTRVLGFQRPEASVAKRWLDENGVGKKATALLPLSGGAPLRLATWESEDQIAPLESVVDSLRNASDPIALAALWDGLLRKHGQFNLEMLVEEVQRWLHDLTLATASYPTRFHAGENLPAHRACSLPQLVSGWREILRFRRSAGHTLNQLLFLEDLATSTLRAIKP